MVGGALTWLGLLLFTPTQGPFVAAQLPLAASISTGGALLAAGRTSGARALAVPLTGALAAILLLPHLAVTFHLLSANPRRSVTVAAVGLSLGAGLLMPWLARCRCRRAVLLFLLALGAALAVAGGALRTLGT